ncbi:unnamed protein product [Thelazia callipaeda]|uniref:Uncharacterized protein n=1 Tax=Thelazia callipaeda TaxID=103827 RepID=A0A0N5CSS1_THECL|nr:unnamed protein product [Thelazia callipaeda]
MVPVHVTLLIWSLIQVSHGCCMSRSTSDFCSIFNMLSDSEQAEVEQYLGKACKDNAVDDAIRLVEKRKPNFIRFGRAMLSLNNDRNNINPNFLRFGRIPDSVLGSDSGQNFLRFERETNEPNFLRFGELSTANVDDEINAWK